ncbi:MAG: tetratricopeptide repeat protein, partial [Candidatus Adiutrix sp.]|nr:tetratricopeptide repeat protein [Candidatus Adiutrix sp.]
MGQAALIIALGLLPAFQPGPDLAPRPLMWETPVSWNVPPPPAAPGLAGSPELESILARAALQLSAGDLKSAQTDYEKILASPNRTAPRALALAGYKNVLRRRIAGGEKFLYRHLIQALKDEWRLSEALALLPVIGADPAAPEEVKKFIRSQAPILALRLGRYDQAAAWWARPAGRQEAGWLARTEQRRGRFGRAAEIWLGLAPKAGKSPGQEVVTAWTCLAKGGLFPEAAQLAEKYPALKKAADYSWRMGLAALAAGDLAQAEIYFKAVLAEGKAQKPRQPGARYFLARTLAEAGRAPEALAIYAELAEGPFNYYHVLARGRLALQAAPPQLAGRLAALLETGPAGRDQDSLGYHLWITEKALSREGMESSARYLLESEPAKPGKGGAFPAGLARLVGQGQWAEVSDLLKKNPGDLAALRPLQPALAASLAAWRSDYRQAVSYLADLPSPDPKGLKKWS